MRNFKVFIICSIISLFLYTTDSNGQEKDISYEYSGDSLTFEISQKQAILKLNQKKIKGNLINIYGKNYNLNRNSTIIIKDSSKLSFLNVHQI